DGHVTGVQTCALPISASDSSDALTERTRYIRSRARLAATLNLWSNMFPETALQFVGSTTRDKNMMSRSLPWNVRASPQRNRLRRSEERRVGKECRARW